MAQVLITDTKLNDIADAVYTKNNNLILPATLEEIKKAIEAIVPSSSLRFQTKSVIPSTTAQTVSPDTGYTALTQVIVGAISTENKTIVTNGTYLPSSGAYFNEIIVNVDTTSQDTYTSNVTVTPTEITQYIYPDEGDVGLLQVTVNPIPEAYKDVSNITATANDVIAGKTFINSSGTSQTGILSVTNYYVGSTAPGSSLGSDGDLYFQV